MSVRLRKFVLFYSFVYLDYGGGRYIFVIFRGNDIEFGFIRMKFSEVVSYFGKVVEYMDLVFGNKNIEFYKVFFMYVMSMYGFFDWFFYKYVYFNLNFE